MSTHIRHGADGANAPMEEELSAWLRAMEPGGAPISLRLRISADLRAEADRRRPVARFAAAFVRAASLAAVVLGAALFALFAVAGAGGASGSGSIGPQYVGGGAGSMPGLGPTFGPGVSPYALLLAAFASVLVGRTFTLPWVPRVVGRLAFGRGDAQPAAPLPFRRPRRSIPLLTWALAAMAVASVALTLWLLLMPGPFMTSLWTPEFAIALYGQIVAAPIAFAVAWRYPRADRSSRVLLLGAVGLGASGLLTLAAWTVSVTALADWLEWINLLEAAGMVALAAGLAGRAGSVARPPLWLAAVTTGAAFLASTYGFFLLCFEFDWSIDLNHAAHEAAGDVAQWLVLVAWLALMWIGLSRWRGGGRVWPWALVLAAGALHLLAIAPNDGLRAWENLFQPALSVEEWTANVLTISRFTSTVSDVSATALLVALLSGLRPLAHRSPLFVAGPGSKRPGDDGRLDDPAT
jgi:hypothetical protein